MEKDPIKAYIDNLPPPSENNSRARVRYIYNKSKKEKYGGYYSRLIEEITGEPSDRTGYDCGMEPEPKNMKH